MVPVKPKSPGRDKASIMAYHCVRAIMLWLILRQLKSRNAAARRQAAEQLAQTPRRGAFRGLRSALEDEDPQVRSAAALALGKLEEEECLEPLLGALRDRDPEVIKAAILALKKIPAEKTIPALTPLVRHADAGVRGYAAQALASAGWRPDSSEDEIWFMVALGHFAQAAAHGPTALPALEAALNAATSSSGVRVIEALGQLGDARAVRPLLQALRSPEPAVCVAAIDTLSRLGDVQAIEPLIPMLRHKNARVRCTAVEALGRFRAAVAADSIRGLLKDSVWEVRREAAESLGRLNDREAVVPLAEVLQDGDADVREAAAISLGSLRDRRAIGPLVLALKDPTSGVRRMTAAALSRIDTNWSSSPEARAAIEELRSALQDNDPGVRHFVGQLLVNLGALEPEAAPGASAEDFLPSSPAKRNKLAVSLFVAVLCDSDRDLRQAAAEALGRLGDPRAESALARLQTDPDAGVRAAAEQAILALADSSSAATN